MAAVQATRDRFVLPSSTIEPSETEFSDIQILIVVPTFYDRCKLHDWKNGPAQKLKIAFIWKVYLFVRFWLFHPRCLAWNRPILWASSRDLKYSLKDLTRETSFNLSPCQAMPFVPSLKSMAILERIRTLQPPGSLNRATASPGRCSDRGACEGSFQRSQFCDEKSRFWKKSIDLA